MTELHILFLDIDNGSYYILFLPNRNFKCKFYIMIHVYHHTLKHNYNVNQKFHITWEGSSSVNEVMFEHSGFGVAVKWFDSMLSEYMLHCTNGIGSNDGEKRTDMWKDCWLKKNLILTLVWLNFQMYRIYIPCLR